MESIEPIVLGLLVAVAALSVIAQFVRIPYPILMVVGGLGLGLIPGAPEVTLDPEVVLVVFLPPLLYVGAFWGMHRIERELDLEDSRLDRPPDDSGLGSRGARSTD